MGTFPNDEDFHLGISPSFTLLLFYSFPSAKEARSYKPQIRPRLLCSGQGGHRRIDLIELQKALEW